MRVASKHALLTRDEILSVSAEAFARNGYVATTLDEVADTIGFTKPSIYYYFSSKYAILEALFDQMIEEYFVGAQRIAQADISPLEKLHMRCDAHIDFVVNRRAWATVFSNAEIHLQPAKRQAVRRRRRKYDQLLQNIYEDGVRQGQFQPADSYAIVAALIGLATSLSVWYRPDGRLSLDDLKATYWNLVTRGFLAPQGAGQAVRANRVLGCTAGGE